MSLSKPTNATNADYANRIGLLFDAVNNATEWTPVLTFDTPGNLSVAYSAQQGEYMQVGCLLIARFRIVTSSFTHSSASGNLRITGLPVTAATFANFSWDGPVAWSGITKANYSAVVANVASATNYITLSISGSGQAVAIVGAGDVPTGGNVVLRGTAIYRVA